MSQSYPSRSAAQREANRQTGNGRVHEVVSKRDIFGRAKYTVRDTGRIANPVERRIARNGTAR